MLYIIPDYYPKFQCIGGSCPSTCCGGWQISIDAASLRKYRRIKGPLRSRLENEIDWEHACFRQYHGFCAFLNDENLCDLYLEGGGKKAFCKACRIFPRHAEEFAGVRELSLSLSCPVVADLILHREKPVKFLYIKKDKQEKSFKNFDFSLFAKLMHTRRLIVQILQNRQKPFSLRAAIVLALAHDLQQRVDVNALPQIDPLLKRYASAQTWDWFERRLLVLSASKDKQKQIYCRLFSILEHLDVIRQDWIPYLENAKKTLTDLNSWTTDQTSSFQEFFCDRTAEQLMVYFVFTYFCGSVYSRNPFTQMKFSFISVILIRELARAAWLQNLESMSANCVTEAAYRLTREIEHSDLNKWKMDQILANEKLFHLEKLFLLL